MKIAVIAGSAPPLSQGGVASAHYNLFRFLREEGFTTKLFTHEDRNVPDGDDPDILRALPIRGVATAMRQATALWFRLTEPGTAAYQLNDVLEWTSAVPALRSNVRAFAPDVIVVPDRGLPLLWLDVPSGCRVIQVEHHNPARFASPLVHATVPARGDIAATVRLGQRALAKANVVVCPSHYMLAELERTFRFAGQTVVIPHVVDAAAFAVKPRSVARELGLAADTPVLYIPAGGSPVKGERYALALIEGLLAARPELGFFISGALSPLLREELSAAGVMHRVYAPGPLPWHLNLALVAGCQAVVAPSLAENLSMAILEALHLGVPVAAFDVGGNRDLIDPTCGALAPFLDLPALVAAAVQLGAAQAAGARVKAADIQAAARSRWLELLR